MRLPAIPFLTKKEKSDFFIALLFDPDKVSAILFEDKNKSLTVLAHHETKLSLQESTVEDLVVACDTVISKLEASLPEDTIVENTIFSVPHSWVEEGKIKQNRLLELKKISSELALVPMGFIVSIEAIVVFLQRKEGAPINAIFVEIADKIVSVYIVRKGEIIDIRQGEIYETVEKTVERLLEKVQLDVLPPTIILLNTLESENIQQKFLAHHWIKDLAFMHLPQVTVLEKGFENEAIINGVAAQMGASLSGNVAVSQFEEIGEGEEYVSSTHDTFGFVEDEDVAVLEDSKKETAEDEVEISHGGPVINDGAVGFREYDEETGDEGVFEEDEVPARRSVSPKSNPIGGILGLIGSIPKKLSISALNIRSLEGRGKLILVLVVVVIVLIAIIALNYMVLTHVTVTLFTDQKNFKDSFGITLTTKDDSSFADKKLKITTATEEVSGEESQETTGTKETGQKAKGQVTIFNKTEQSQSLEKGATIVSSNGLEFTLSDKINIASTSSFSTSFSSQNVNVEAAKFGKEYNIPSGTNFTVKNVSSSQIFAKNDVAFSGGTKEEIQIVSDKDLSNLEDTVTNRLFDKAKSQVKAKLSTNDALIPVIIDSNFKDKNFDKKVNDQAKSVKLSATVDYTIGIYNKDELAKFLSSSNDYKIPSDFKLSDNDSQIEITDVKQGKNDLTAKLTFNAIFKPALTLNEIPQKIKGQQVGQAQNTLKSISGVSDVNIKFANNLPGLPLFLPFNPKNIQVDVKAQ